MKMKRIEALLLTSLFGLLYFSPIVSAQLPVFWGEFNNLDGSLYFVRFLDVFISVLIVTLASRQIIPRRLDRRSISKIFTTAVLIVGTASLVEFGWDRFTLYAFNLPSSPGEVSDKMLANPNREILNLSIVTGNLMLLLVGLFYGIILDRSRQLRRSEQLERENLEAEVKYLRSQINPHFLFNTLNNIFAITQRNEDQEGSDALLRLAGLMRYMLYESEGTEIRLNKEVEHLENYRDLMLLKYSTKDPPQVRFQMDSIPTSCQVAPLILLPFVENAFKHGIDNKGNGSIEVQLEVVNGSLQFRVTNSIWPERTVNGDHQGIGLENVKRRLEHLYPQRHTLQIKENMETYKIELWIQLS